jgi:hypothetical protein
MVSRSHPAVGVMRLSNSLNTYSAPLSPSNATTIGCALFQVDILLQCRVATVPIE